MRSCVPANDVIKLSLLFIFADRWECKKGLGGGGQPLLVANIYSMLDIFVYTLRVLRIRTFFAEFYPSVDKK